MKEKDELTLIKEQYGEQMMHFCRKNFQKILDKPGVLFSIISDHFAPSKFLYEDIVRYDMEAEFISYIFKNFEYEKEERFNSKLTLEELMDKAGYKIVECTTEEQIQKFRVFYDKGYAEYIGFTNGIPKHIGEELCTFDGGRLNQCYVYFAVKKNVIDIKRENFPEPKREDEYGTSVISIQFTKDPTHMLSIKNRYNHTVTNPDATFGNNLDNIIPGLTNAFEQRLGFKINYNDSSFELLRYVMANDGKYYKFNYEINNVYYCPNNIIIDNFKVIKLDPARYILMDYYILDNGKEKSINTYSSTSNAIIDSFVDPFEEIEKVNISSIDKETGERTITINKDIVIVLDKYNRIVKYKNNNIGIIASGFMQYNTALRELEINNASIIQNQFLYNNESLLELNLPNVTRIGDYCLYVNSILDKLNTPKLKEIGKGFLFFTDFEKLSTKNISEELVASNDLGSLIRYLSRSFGNRIITEEEIEREMELAVTDVEIEREIDLEAIENHKKRGL